MTKTAAAKTSLNAGLPKSKFFASPWLLGLLLVVSVICAYQPAWHAGFIWDDDVYVTNNPLLTASDGLWRIWFSLDSPSQYFPLIYTTFRFEHWLWGFNATGYHLFNILLHAGNALLVWRLLKRLAVPGAWLAATIFALHPVQVESAAWITECKNVQMCFFFLLTLLCWIEFIERTERRWWFYGLALVLYALSLCSKTTACTLPAALVLILWLKHQPIDWRRWLQIVPFVAMGIGMGLLTVWWERFHQGTQGATFSLNWIERFLVAGHAVWFYIGKLFWPVDLIFSYPKWMIQTNNPLDYVWLAGLVGLGALIYYARRFVGRSVETGVVFFVATLSPLLGFFMLYTFRYTFVADHYQYVACIGLIALVAAGITMAFERLGTAGRFLQPICCGLLLLTLGTLTWRQCGMYSNQETLWTATIQRNPNSFMAYNNLGHLLEQNGQIDRAIFYYKKSIEIRPDHSEAWNNLGNALLQKGQTQQAIADYQKALAFSPHYAEAQNNWGNALLNEGHVDQAMVHYRKALEMNPRFAEAHYNLGVAHYKDGHADEAIAEYRRSLALDPDQAHTHIDLGIALFDKGQLDDAKAQYQEALKINPDSAIAHSNLGLVLFKQRRVNEAIAQYRRSLEINSTNAVVYSNLGLALFKTGQVKEAIASAQQALALAGHDNAPLADIIRKQIETYRATLPGGSK